MRIRSIKPEFWHDELVASWPIESRLAYIALWNEADDAGRLRASPSYLRSALFPYDHRLNMETVLEPIIASARILIYSVNGQQYGQLVNFKKHQVINRPGKSRLPEPPELLTESSVSVPGVLPEHSVSPPGVLIAGTGNREQGAGSREQGTGKAAAVAPDCFEKLPEILLPYKDKLAEWFKYKRSKKQMYKHVYLPQFYALTLKEIPLNQLAEAIDYCIGKNYDGLFSPKSGQRTNNLTGHRLQPGEDFNNDDG